MLNLVPSKNYGQIEGNHIKIILIFFSLCLLIKENDNHSFQFSSCIVHFTLSDHVGIKMATLYIGKL